MDNIYTIRHLKFNQDFLWVFIRGALFLILIFATIKNFGIRSGLACFDNLLLIILMLVRAAAVLYLFGFIVPDVYRLGVSAWYMNKDNWWKSPEEPFITNASWVNAFFAWAFWLPVMYVIIFLLVSPILLPLVSWCIRRRKISKVLKEFFWEIPSKLVKVIF